MHFSGCVPLYTEATGSDVVSRSMRRHTPFRDDPRDTEADQSGWRERDGRVRSAPAAGGVRCQLYYVRSREDMISFVIIDEVLIFGISERF